MGRFDNYKFRPSSLGKLMTNPPGKKDTKTFEEFSETAKTYLLECFVSERYGREKDITNRYIEKGKLQEEESITLYSRCTKRFHKKNEERIQNDFIIGTPDLFDGESITNAESVIDIKTSWDIFTFFAVLTKSLNKDYDWQLQGYMDLTGAKNARLVYCLVDTPYHLIEESKYYLAKKMGVVDPVAHPEYQEACKKMEKNMLYSDIPLVERYIEYTIERDQDKIDAAHERVLLGREFLNSLMK